MKTRIDADNGLLKAVLEELVQADKAITVREVARLHPSLKNASDFTRNTSRMALIARYQERQNEFRAIKHRVAHKSDIKTKEELAAARQQVAELEASVGSLVSSHVGMVTAVLRAGGMSALEGFWRDYRDVSHRVRELGAVQPTASVVMLRPGLSDT